MHRALTKFSPLVAALVVVGVTAGATLTPSLVSPAGAVPSPPPPSCDVNVGGGTSPFATIQQGIDAAVAGQTICVYPGLYDQDQANGRTVTGPVPFTDNFNIFVGTPNLTIEGLDASGNLITAAPEGLLSTQAPVIEANRALHPTFGSSDIFVQADNVTLRGLEINGDPNSIAKSLEITANNVTVTDVAFTPSTAYSGAGDISPSTIHGGTGIYISDFNFNPAAGGSSEVQSYTFANNTFDGNQNEPGIYVASGAGWTGAASGRVISGNKFSNMEDPIDFAGPTPGIAWLQYPVGAATISGNSFAGTARSHVLVWGAGGAGVGYISPSWCSIMTGNSFDSGAFTWQGATECPGGNARTWAEDLSGTGGPNYANIAGLYSTIQRYAINESLTGDTVQVLPGTYDEALTIDHALTLNGANVGVSGTGARGPESLVERLAADTGPDFNITTPASVTVNGFRAQFNATDGPDQNGGVLNDFQGTANALTFANNIVDGSTYTNSLVFDDNGGTANFQNNLFTNITQSGAPSTGVVAAWGFTGPGTPSNAISFTGNTFSHITSTDGDPAINLNTVSGTVSGNTFEDIHQYGILLAGTLGNLAISGNLFDNIHNDSPSTSANRGSGIRTFQTPNFVGPVTVTGNTFSNDYHGVRVANDGPLPANLSSGDFVVNRNAFTTDTSDGISLDPATTGVLNGMCNWWGSASGPSDAGPGSGTGITAGATFSPFLVTSNLSGTCGAAVVAPPTITEVFDGSNSSAPPTALGVAFTPGPGGPFTSFTVTCGALNGGPTASASGPASPIFVGGLGATGAYQCTVTETNGSGTSAPSAPFTLVLGGPAGSCPQIPSAPTNLSRGPGNNSATVSWAPSNVCVAGYVVTPFVGGVAQVALSKLIPGPGTTTVMKNLTNGVAYQFTVAAENGAVVGPASILTGPITAGTPSATTVTHLARVAKGALKVTFKAGASNGAPITSFTATCTSSNHGATKSKTGKSGPLTVTGLTAGKSYTCTVKATNKRGTGPASRSSGAVKA